MIGAVRAILLLLMLLVICASVRAEEVRRPSINTGFAISLSEPDLLPTPGIGVYEIDLFDVSQATIDALHAGGGYVICYLSVGSFEDWRPDAAAFPKTVLGKDYSGWEGERWLDIRDRAALAPIIEARLDLARSKQCDAVDADNVDGFSNDTGFSITENDQRGFNRWVADAAHARGLAVGLKNAAELVPALVDAFDFAVVEGCATEGACGAFRPFADQRKAVFQIEYEISDAEWSAVCATARESRFTPILTDQELDGRGKTCSDR